MMVGLVACCKSKRAEPSPACEMYTSALFSKSSAYIKRHCVSWGILSARYGLLEPTTIIAPYELSLLSMDSQERQAWALRTRAQLIAMYPHAQFLVIAGSFYRAALHGLPHEAPFSGLSIGRLLHRLNEERR
jgi:hypothetical protein